MSGRGWRGWRTLLLPIVLAMVVIAVSVIVTVLLAGAAITVNSLWHDIGLQSNHSRMEDNMTPPYKRIHVVINPASGKGQPMLKYLADLCRQYDVEWDISITKKYGDATQQAKDALARGVDQVGAAAISRSPTRWSAPAN